MLVPLLIATASVGVGALLGLVGRRGHASSLATFALVSALAVVLAQLLPDALAGAGIGALAVFAVGGVAPTVIEKLAVRAGRRGAGRLGLELGYVGLLAHKVGDGIGLGTYGGEHHAGHGHADVMLAIAAHTVPMVALVTLAFRRASGRPQAAARALGLALATGLGVALPSVVPTAVFEPAEPWITAAVAGLLLHVLAHDWQPEGDATSTTTRRWVDLLAVAAALGLVLVGGHSHEEGGGQVREAMGAALLDLTLETAPALLVGLALGAVLSTMGGRLPTRWLTAGGPTRQALRGAVVGAPLPICACGVLPLAASLRRRGAGAALVVSFLLATPELGIETLALTVRFVGWPFALVRVGAAVLLAIVAALVVHRVSGAATSGPIEPTEPEPEGSFLSRALSSFDELLHHVAPWTVVGIIAAAYVQAVLPADSVVAIGGHGLDVLAVTLVAVPAYVCAASATPLAAVLLLKGMSPAAVLVGLLLGPATNLATVGFLRQSYGARAALMGMATAVGVSWGVAALVEVSGLPVHVDPVMGTAHDHGAIAIVAAVLLALAIGLRIFRLGLRPWLGTLSEALGAPAPHGHHHHGHHHHDHARAPDGRPACDTSHHPAGHDHATEHDPAAV